MVSNRFKIKTSSTNMPQSEITRIDERNLWSQHDRLTKVFLWLNSQTCYTCTVDTQCINAQFDCTPHTVFVHCHKVFLPIRKSNVCFDYINVLDSTANSVALPTNIAFFVTVWLGLAQILKFLV